MPRVKPEYKLERRAKILDAARACFARSGFHRTTLQDIFAEAGLSAGAVYNYFQSKDELILAIADERHAHEQSMLSESLAAGDPRQALRALALRFAELYLSDEAEQRRKIALQTWSQATLSEPVLASVKFGQDEPRGQIAALVRRGQTQGVMSPDLDAEAVARSVTALLHGFMLQKLWDPALDISPCRDVFERFVDSLCVR